MHNQSTLSKLKKLLIGADQVYVNTSKYKRTYKRNRLRRRFLITTAAFLIFLICIVIFIIKSCSAGNDIGADNTFLESSTVSNTL